MQLTDLNWPAVKALSPDTPVVVPIGALEQHGHHLPLFTDSMLLGEVVRRADERLNERVLFVPLMWLGSSCHHLEFPGTLSAGPRVYLDLLNNLIDNLVRHGFRRIVFLNGHGGNVVPGRQVIFEARQRYRERDDLALLLATYWGLGPKERDWSPMFHQKEMGHACEWETSMILRIAPHLVGEVTGLEDVPFGFPYEPAYSGWITKDRTTAGHIGAPRHATAEKGEVLFRRFTEDVVAFLEGVAQRV
jgi:creatinine amidohydrolase